MGKAAGMFINTELFGCRNNSFVTPLSSCHVGLYRLEMKPCLEITYASFRAIVLTEL